MHLITKFHLTAYKFFLFKIYFPSLNFSNVKNNVEVHEKFCQVWSLSLHPPSWANCFSLAPQPELSQDSEIQVFSKCGHFPYPRPDPDCISPVSPAKISRHDPWLTVGGNVAAIYLFPEMLSEESLFPLKITSLSAPTLSFSNTNSVINCLKLQIISCLWVRGFLDVVLRTYINYLIFVFSQSNHSFQHLK